MRLSHLLEEVTTSQDVPILANGRKLIPGPSRGKSPSPGDERFPAKVQNEGVGRVNASIGEQV